MSVIMQAPSGVSSVTVSTSGTTYTANSAGQINAQNSDVSSLLGIGFSVVSGPAAFQSNFRNFIEGGDFTCNPWQRNIAGLASGGVISASISNTVTYFPDRFFAVGGSSSAVLMAQVADSAVQGFTQDLKVSRQSSNANTATINLGQVLETSKSIALQGQQVTLSFYAKQGANYSGGALSVQIITGTGTNQGASAMVGQTWTGFAAGVTGSVTLSTSMTKYSITGNIPATATQVGVLFSWVPTGTAGSDDNSVSINGVQLEIGAGSAFEHRPPQVELSICQRSAWVIAEPASGIAITQGMNTSSSAQLFEIDAPVTMRAAPTLTISSGSFKSNQAGTPTACTLSAGSQTAGQVNITGNTACTAGQASLLQGGGGSGYIVASCDF